MRVDLWGVRSSSHKSSIKNKHHLIQFNTLFHGPLNLHKIVIIHPETVRADNDDESDIVCIDLSRPLFIDRVNKCEDEAAG